MSGASGEDSGGDGDSASLVGDSYDVDGDDDGPAIEWQEIRGATEGDEDDMLGQEELLEEDGKAPMSPTGEMCGCSKQGLSFCINKGLDKVLIFIYLNNSQSIYCNFQQLSKWFWLFYV